jgi:two-component system, cell cycle sensor histidine kinase and response regulator CckA
MALIHDLSQLVDAATGLARQRHKDPFPQEGQNAAVTEESESQRIQMQLWHGQRLEALGRLAAGIAHDFGNLLTVILGCSELLEDRLNPDDPRRDLVAEIHKAGAQAERLTRQILGFAGRQALDPQVLDLGQVLSSTEKMLRRLIGENLFLSTIVSPRVWPVKVDRGQIQQVIVNLVVNARDAMPGGGTMTIEIANVTRGQLSESGEPLQPGNYVMLAFHDTGTGMSPTTKAHIFEPFFTTKAPGKGTGLGLFMVDDIVKQNGGHIEVHTEIGRGSTFRVYLPQAKEPAPAQRLEAESGPMPKGDEVVLLVEDEDAVRHLIRQVLQMNGYKVLEAVDGKEAVELADQHAGPIHLLLSDVVMPHLGGCQLAEAIRVRHPLLKVLFLSGHSIDYLYEHGAEHTVFAFLQKPFTVGALARKVRDVLNQQVDTKHD